MFYLKDIYESVHLFDERLSYPVMLYAKSKQALQIISNYLTKKATKNFDVIDFINWSVANTIVYQIIFPTFIT